MRRSTFITIASLALSATSCFAFCFDEAGQEYGVSPEILYNIACVESQMNPYAVGRNKNGTYDYGLMQVNSIWAKTLGGAVWKAQSDPCTNVKTGAWILRQCIAKYGNTWKGVGCYHSRTPALNERYAKRVYASMIRNRKLAAADQPRATVLAAVPTENNDEQTQMISQE